MPPKKEKDRVYDDTHWRSIIEETPLNEESWQVKVIIFEIAGGEQEITYLNRFENYAKEEKRFVVKNICKSETMFMINQLGGDKKIKDDSLRVFEEGYIFLKEKKDIPPDILALIIKHLILKMKEEYISIQRQKLVVKEGMRNESLIMIDKLEIKNNVPIKVDEPPPPSETTQTNSKGKKGEGDAQPPPPRPEEGKKYNTLLRERGEEWRDKVYVDDFPLDGPNLYVAITGFLEPYLLENLIKIDVPLTALVQIRMEPVLNIVSSGYLTGTKRGHSAIELAAEKARVFWETLEQLRLGKDTTNTYNNMVFTVYNPPYNTHEELSSNSEKIYDELSYLMYDIQDLTRQHIHYLNNMDVKVIPMETENSSLLNFYQNHINAIPLECVTIYTIMDIMLHTIDAEYADIVVNNSRTSLISAETLIQPSSMSNNDLEKAENLIDKVFATLSKNDSDRKKYRLTCGELYDKFENPVIINYGDCAKLSYFHLDTFNIDDFILSSLINMPFCNLWKNQTILSDNLKAKVNFHINNLLSCFDREDLDDSLLNRLIHILSFRKLYNNRSSLRDITIPPNTISEFKKIYLKRSMFAEPLLKRTSFCNSSATTPSNPFTVKSDSYCKEFSNEIETEENSIKFLFSCPDLSELVSVAEILNNKPQNHFIDEFDYFEDFTGINALQMLFEAFSKFNCLNYKYCEVTDSFEIMFFNDQNEDGIWRNEWRCHLPTPICLQDFYDFVFEEQYEWIQEEEKIYDEIAALKTQLQWKESLVQVPVKTCIENIDEIDSELLIIGSLKYKEKFPSESVSNEEVDQNQSLSKLPLSSLLTEPDTGSIQKTKQRNQVSKKQIRETFIEFNADIISEDNQYSKLFSGYDLGNRRVEVFGRDSVYFGKDGSKVSTFYTITIPMNLEHLNLNVALGNGDNEFCMHKTLGDTKSFNYTCNSECFRIHGKDQVIMYLKKNLYEVPIDRITTPPLRKSNVKESEHKINVKQSTSTNSQAIRRESYNSFIISWPNGLIIESVHGTNSPAISHIKQYFITPPSHIFEHMRCITLKGEVIIFKKSGCVEVFRPDGTFINITNCSKKVVNLETTEDVQSNVSSDKGKSKKGKGNKSKDKLGATISKSSKATLDQNQVPEMQLQYDLFIDEFEITDVNGLKQTFTNDHLVSTEKVLIRTAVDYCLGEVLSRRMDGTTLLLNENGDQVTTFHDNTLIITSCIVEEQEIYSESIDSNVVLTASNTLESNKVSKTSLSQKSQESVASSNNTLDIEKKTVKTEKNRDCGFVSIQIVYTVEHSNFATVVINKANGTVNIESANKANLSIDNANNFDFYLDESTSASFDGKYLDVICKACNLCHSCSKFKIKIDDTQSDSDINQCWLSMRDSFGKNIVVDDEGGIDIVEEPYKEKENAKKEETDTENLSEICLTLQGKCRELYEANMFRFFVFNRNLTCSELIHRSLIDKYKLQCRWQPWCSINEYNTFGDHRTLISVLTPVHLTQTEKWLMKSKYSNKPKQLKYKDLREDLGKGFYHWMRPYKRFQPQPTEVENLELPRLPRAYVLRTLEQLWNEEIREKFKGGKEIVAAVLRYRKLMELDSQTILNVPIRDPRSIDEKAVDEKLQDIAQRIYNDLKIKIADEIQASAQPTITTEASSPPQYLIGDRGEVTCDELKKNWEEKSAAYVTEVEEAEKLSPNLERYWKRRAEEAREEEFYKQLLREESIPPYFRNILGGAAWGEVETRPRADPCHCVKPCTEEIHVEAHNADSQ